MQYEYKTKGTCSQRIFFEIEDGKLKNVQYLGGCNGNLQGISALVEGTGTVRGVSLETLFKIADVLGIPPSKLLEDD